jgi:hypothetical protein
MEAIEVTAHFDLQGEIEPRSFKWQGSTYPVESTGRRWRDDKGVHILVMAGGERVFELLFDTRTGRWFLNPAGQRLV